MQQARLPGFARAKDPQVRRNCLVEAVRFRSTHLLGPHQCGASVGAPGINLQRAIEIATRQFFGHTNSVHGASVIRRDRGVEDDDAYLRALDEVTRVPGVGGRLPVVLPQGPGGEVDR